MNKKTKSVRNIGVSRKEVEVRHEDWTNNETGETKTFAVVGKDVKQDINWWKLWLPELLKVLDEVGNKKIKVLNYIMDSISSHDNTFGGTIREIAANCNVSINTVQSVINSITKKYDFLVKVRSGQYIVNPRFIAKGRHNKRMGIMQTFDTQVRVNKEKELKGQKKLDL